MNDGKRNWFPGTILGYDGVVVVVVVVLIIGITLGICGIGLYTGI